MLKIGVWARGHMKKDRVSGEELTRRFRRYEQQRKGGRHGGCNGASSLFSG